MLKAYGTNLLKWAFKALRAFFFYFTRLVILIISHGDHRGMKSPIYTRVTYNLKAQLWASIDNLVLQEDSQLAYGATKVSVVQINAEINSVTESRPMCQDISCVDISPHWMPPLNWSIYCLRQKPDVWLVFTGFVRRSESITNRIGLRIKLMQTT